MRASLFAASTLAALLLPTVAYAAPPSRISDENLRTLDPGTTCVRGPQRPFIAGPNPRLDAFVPAEGDFDRPQGVVQFRLKDLGTGRQVFTAESNSKIVGYWFEAQRKPELANGRTYSWQARFVDDETGESTPWSKGCELSVDTVRPSAPDLTISPGPYKSGEDITLTFGTAGTPDVARYGYALVGDETEGYVDVRVGKVTVKLTHGGPTTVRAWSYDRAGLRSLVATEIDIMVAEPTS